MFKWELINDDTGERLVLNKDGEYIDPHGWEDIALEHNRSERYDSIFLDFSRDLSFHCKGGGKEMLDEIYEEKGSEGKATLKIYFKCEGNFKLLSECYISFASYKEEFKGKKLHTTVEVRKKGISSLLLSRDETDVDLLSEVSLGGVQLNPYAYAPYTMNLHSRIIYLESRWEADGAHFCCLRFPMTALAEARLVPKLKLINDDIEESVEIDQTCSADNNFIQFWPGAPPIINTTSNKNLTQANTFTVEYDFAGQIEFTTYEVSIPPDPCDPSTCGTGAIETKLIDAINIRLRLYYGKDENQDVSESCPSPLSSEDVQYIDLVSNPQFALTSNPFVLNFAGSGSQNIVLEHGTKVWIHWIIQMDFQGPDGDLNIGISYTSSDLKIYSNTVSDATSAHAVAIHEAWSRICESITDQTLAFKSEFFGRKNSQGLKYNQNGYGSFTAILDGLRIRGFQKSDVVQTQTGGGTASGVDLNLGYVKKGIITNVKDIYDACNAVWGIGLGIETHDGVEVVRVEEKHYYYQNVEIIKISNIPNLEMSFAEDMAFSEVQLGYEKWKTESKGGLDEPLTLARWIFPKIKEIKNVKELTSPFVAAMYAIEKTRRKKPSATEDSDYDDDIFFIATSRTRPDTVPNTELTIAEKNENIWVDPSTLLAPETAYNLRFNLFSNFDRTMNQFTNNLTKDSPQQINYSYLEGNGQMAFAYIEADYDQAGNLNKLGSNNVQNTELPNGRHQRQYPLVVPEIYTFTYAIPFSDYLDILDNPYGYISFSSTEQKYKKGYIKTLSYNISRQMAEFTLIRKFD